MAKHKFQKNNNKTSSFVCYWDHGCYTNYQLILPNFPLNMEWFVLLFLVPFRFILRTFIVSIIIIKLYEYTNWKYGQTETNTISIWYNLQMPDAKEMRLQDREQKKRTHTKRERVSEKKLTKYWSNYMEIYWGKESRNIY